MSTRHHWAGIALLGVLAGSAAAQQSLTRFDVPLVVTDQTTRFEALLDLDADGDSDVVDWLWTNTNGTTVRVGGWINDGNGVLTNAWNVPLTFATNVFNDGQDSAVGHLNGDARDDFALSFGKRVVLFTSNGAAPPTQLTPLDLPAGNLSIELADFDGDGLDDLATSDGSVTVWLNTPNFGFVAAEPAWNTLGLGNLDDLHVVQYDGDGKPDLADIGDVSVYFYKLVDGILTGTSSLVHGLGAVNTNNTLAVGDVDGDGDDDAVVFDLLGGRSAVLRHGAGGWAAEPVALQSGPATHLADVNGDGAADGVCCSSGGGTPSTTNNATSLFEVALNDGSGHFAAAFGIPSLGGHHIAGAADMDGDGDVDLVAGRSIYFARGPLVKAPQPLLSLDPIGLWPVDGLTNASIADCDGDGDPDALFGIGSVAANAGDGTFALRSIAYPDVPGNKKWLGPGTPGDFDGDGDVDLLISRWQGQFTAPTYLDAYVLRNNGSGLQPQAVLATNAGYNTSPGTIAVWDHAEASLVADADGDGDLDVFRFTDDSGGSTRLSRNDGTGFFSFGADFGEGRVVAVTRLNADTLPDLVLAGFAIHVRLGIGGGAFGAPQTLSTPMELGQRIALQDVDGNGATDIVASDVNTGAITVQLNNGSGVFSANTALFAAWPLHAGSSSYPQRLVSVDVDDDGRLDLVASPAGPTLNSAWVLVRDAAGPGWSATQQVLVPGGATDFDGDGDDDLVGQQLQSSIGPSRLLRNLAHDGAAAGLRWQYGAGNPGTGGAVPVLGATGPFRAGEHAALRITGLPASKLGIVTIGLAQSALPNTPWLGSTGYNWPWLVYFILPSPAGQPGVAGSASIVLNFVVSPAMAGVGNLYHQVWWADGGAMFGRSSSNGLLIDCD